jgi:hypothetical protein
MDAGSAAVGSSPEDTMSKAAEGRAAKGPAVLLSLDRGPVDVSPSSATSSDTPWVSVRTKPWTIAPNRPI